MMTDVDKITEYVVPNILYMKIYRMLLQIIKTFTHYPVGRILVRLAVIMH